MSDNDPPAYCSQYKELKPQANINQPHQTTSVNSDSIRINLLQSTDQGENKASITVKKNSGCESIMNKFAKRFRLDQERLVFMHDGKHVDTAMNVDDLDIWDDEDEINIDVEVRM